MEINLIIQQIFILLVLALIGVIAVKRGIIKDEIKTGLSQIIFNITLPFLIITQVSSLEINKEILLNWLIVIVLVFLSIIFFLVLGKITDRILKLPPKKSIIHILHTAFTNAVFLGFPILDALFPGGEGILYGIIYFLVQNTTMWTLGVYLLTREKGKKTNKIDAVKKLLNPNTIAFFIGLAMLFLNIQIPGFMFDSLHGFGKTTLYLAMLYVGAMLADFHFKTIVRDKTTFILSLNKLIIGPILFIFILKALVVFTPLSLNQTALTVIVLEAAMPCQTLMVILAKTFNKDDVYATQNLSVSTLLSIVTLPLIYFISQIILSTS
ncbi:MAG: AEC family transporter [Bacteroidales bacterium]